MTESALADTRDTSGFDAVLVTCAASNVRAGGMRLVERCAFALARAGAKRLLCIGPSPAPDLRLPELAISWLRPSDDLAGWSTATGRPIIGLNASTLVDARAIASLADAPGAGPLSDSEGHLWRCQPSMLPSMVAATRPGPRRDDVPGTGTWHPPETALLRPVRNGTERTSAEETLLERLGRPNDGWFTRVVDRRASRVLTKRFMHTRIVPNQITMISITVGIVGGLLFSIGSHAATSAGALLFLFSTILDGCDGELARLTYRESRTGALLDVVGDNVVHLVLFGGLAAGLYRVMPAGHIAFLGAALVVGAIAAIASVYFCILRGSPTPAQQTLFETFAGREFAYLLAGLALAGRLALFLWIAAVGIYVFAGGLWLLGRVGKPTAP